jgi:hypothetical protein
MEGLEAELAATEGVSLNQFIAAAGAGDQEQRVRILFPNFQT